MVQMINPLSQPSTGVVITGGASGIGKAAARCLLEVGRPVSVWDIDEQNIDATRAELEDEFHGLVEFRKVDVAKPDQIICELKATEHSIGNIGGLVHAAGIPGPGTVDVVTEDAFDQVIAVNLRAALTLIRESINYLKKANPGSAITVISSVEGLIGNSLLFSYCASKSGLLGIVRASAQRLGLDGIRINAICPGAVNTPMLKPLLAIDQFRERLIQNIPLRTVAEPAQIGKSIRFLLSNEADYITGTAFVIDGGLTAVGGF